MHQVTSQLSVTGRITRKYTRQVTKTKTVQAKRGVHPPDHPKKMKILISLPKEQIKAHKMDGSSQEGENSY